MRRRYLLGRVAAWVMTVGGALTIGVGGLLIAEALEIFAVPNLNVSLADGGIAVLIGAAAVALSLQAHAIFDTADLIEDLTDRQDDPTGTPHGRPDRGHAFEGSPSSARSPNLGREPPLSRHPAE